MKERKRARDILIIEREGGGRYRERERAIY